MSITVNISKAKAQLSRLVERVIDGEEVIITKAGKPVARLTRWQPARKTRKFGTAKKKITILPGFDDPVPGFEEFY